jgi:hypothetical protein
MITGVDKSNIKNISQPFELTGVVQGSRNDNAARLAGNLIAKGVTIEMVEFFRTVLESTKQTTFT